MTKKELRELVNIQKKAESIMNNKPELPNSHPLNYRDYAAAIRTSLNMILNNELEVDSDLGKVLVDTYKTLWGGMDNYQKRLEIQLASVTIIKPEDFHG